MQETRLRQSEPLEGAIINRAQNSFAGQRQEGRRMMHHSVGKQRDGTLMIRARIGVGRRNRILRGVLMRAGAVAHMILPSIVQPSVQLWTDARERKQ